ncbi:MAG: Gfo/Idh/MocA family oxidoreductase [Pirellulales bacterium]|nr:Gfo/Idh/MocA family oxidoreductase [Pirellulales bacterium]
MSAPRSNIHSRRTFLKNGGRVAAASALAGTMIPPVHAGEDNTIRLALIGAGGRGTGATGDALNIKNGPIKLVAMADAFEDRVNLSHDKLIRRNLGDRMDVPKERRFVGLDAYRKAMDVLRPGDVAILGTPPGFRWVHFGYAIEKGLNVFMEKPITVDGPTTRTMLAQGEESVKKNLKVGVGLMCRHCKARQALYKRIRDGQIGEILMLRVYRIHPPAGTPFAGPCPKGMNEVEYQIRNFHSFLWASGGLFSDYLIHQIDECSWMKDSWPVQAQGVGGRHYRGEAVDQNFDNYAVEYTYDDGAKLFLQGRYIVGGPRAFASYAHGTKAGALICNGSHSPARCAIMKNQQFPTTRRSLHKNSAWSFPQPEPKPYHLEWDALIRAIREDTPYNEVQRGAMASLVTSMGRMAVHTAETVTRDELLNGDHEFAPGLDKLAFDGPAPLQAGPDGKYPIPMPGLKRREF